LTNQFPGLARGPIDHDASSVINVIANDAITMGSVVNLKDLISPSVPAELLPRVDETLTNNLVTGLEPAYGIAVGGDIDGIYGDGSAATGPENQAASGAGEGVVVVTQGRCLARVTGNDSTGAGTGEDIEVGDPLTMSFVTLAVGSANGVLFKADTAVSGQLIVARALQKVLALSDDIIAVDFQREGFT